MIHTNQWNSVWCGDVAKALSPMALKVNVEVPCAL